MMISLMLSDLPCECIISLSPSTLSLSPSSQLPFDVPAPSPEQQQAIVQRLYTASATAAVAGNPTNFNSLMDQQTQQQSCSYSDSLDKFILPLKEAHFTHKALCNC